MDPKPHGRRRISFFGDLELTTGSRRDWPYFARWHYRGHGIGVVRFVTVLWHRVECGVRSAECGMEESSDSALRIPHSALPVGLCLFTAPPLSLAGRNRYFGLGGRWSRTRLRLLNSQLVMLSRVVLHPTYRGAGLAAPFVSASCRACGFDWVETLAQMGRVNPFFERAGFVRVDVPPRRRSRRKSDRRSHSNVYGGRRGSLVSEEAHRKSRYTDPVYYVLDNRQHTGKRREEGLEEEACHHEEAGERERNAR